MSCGLRYQSTYPELYGSVQSFSSIQRLKVKEALIFERCYEISMHMCSKGECRAVVMLVAFKTMVDMMSCLVSHFSSTLTWPCQSPIPWLPCPKHVCFSCQMVSSCVSACPHAQSISLHVNISTIASTYATLRSPSRRITVIPYILILNLVLLWAMTLN
jgi:hypothetical protein